MKKNLLTSLFCLCAIFCFNLHSNAQSTLIYYWDFNGGGTDSAGRMPDYKASGAGSAYFDYWCAYVDFTVGSSTNLQTGYAADSCIRFRNPADSVTFFMPTTGYQNVHLSYAEQRTNSGSASNSVFYTNDGVTWIPSSAVDIIDSSTYTVDSTDAAADSTVGWQLQTFDFNLDGRTVNNPHFGVTIVFNGVSSATSGNDRFDNITLKGDTYVAEGVKTVTAATANYTLFPNPVANSLNINATTDGAKSVSVSNALGQKVFEETKNGTNFSLNTAGLSTGMYIISIRENSTGEVTTMKFTKQ